jgi:hypothetical protein
MTTYLDKILAILNECGDQIDALCYTSDRDCANSQEARKGIAQACQKILAATLALAGKHGLCENIMLNIGDGSTHLTRLEAVRQLVHGSSCEESFGETLEMLGKRLRSGGASHD